MSKLLRSTKSLPPWFDIKKYEPLRSLDLFGWAAQIINRHIVLDTLRPYFSDQKSLLENSKEYQDKSVAYLKRISESPIYPDWKPTDIFVEQPKMHPYNRHSVWSMSALDAYWFVLDAQLRGKVWEPIINAGNAVNSGEPNPEQWSVADTPIDFIYINQGTLKTNASLMVNLEATDEQIVSDFCHWLKHYRNEVRINSLSRNFTEKDFLAWFSNGVIPYIDLEIWSLIEGCKISQSVLGDAIFPYDEVDRTQKIRKGTIPRVEEVLDEKCCSALLFQTQNMADTRQKSV